MALTRRLSGGAGLRSRRPPPRQSPISYMFQFTPPQWYSFAPPLTAMLRRSQRHRLRWNRLNRLATHFLRIRKSCTISRSEGFMRHHHRQEPYAAMPLVRICARGGGQPLFLTRPVQMVQTASFKFERVVTFVIRPEPAASTLQLERVRRG